MKREKERKRDGVRALVPGISPPARGNPKSQPPIPAERRSIPACAGEPTSSNSKRSERGTVKRPRKGSSAFTPAMLDETKQRQH